MAFRKRRGINVLDPVFCVLGDTFRDPSQAADLLLLEFEERIKDAELELLQEGELVQVHLVLEKVVLQTRSDVARSSSSSGRRMSLCGRVGSGCGRRVEERSVLQERVQHGLDLVHIVRARERHRPRGVQPPQPGQQLTTLFLGQRGAERVDRDVERTPIGFKVEDRGHDVAGGGAEGHDERVEIFEVGAVQLRARRETQAAAACQD